MVRLLAVNLLFFLLPFAAYAAWLLITRRTIGGAGDWPRRMILWLAVAGAALMVAVLVVFTSFTGAPPGAVYVPATIVDGKLIPGHFEYR
ncbi:MAG: hypothetical protein J0H63_01380 [Rhizobiales bacterium]|nr:hypothetical protein [Hyphomicrobiales bacterium]MBN9008820.1 hypothetical protein [Hyphomicrobiales bacterium]